MTCSAGSLAAGQSATVTIAVTPTIAGTLSDTATATTANVTSDTDYTATATTTVQGA